MLQRKRHTERFSLHWFTSQMATTAGWTRPKPAAKSFILGYRGPSSWAMLCTSRELDRN